MNIWEILGVDSTSDKETIEKVYVYKLKKLDMEGKSEKIQQLQEAFNIAIKEKARERNHITVECYTRKGEQSPKLVNEIFEEVCFNVDSAALKRYLDQNSNLVDIDKYEEERQEVYRFLFENCFYLSKEICCFLVEYFSFCEQDDIIYGQTLIQNLKNCPQFLFKDIHLKFGVDPKEYFQQRFELFDQLKAIGRSDESWLQRLANCRERVIEDMTLDYLELCYYFQKDFRLQDRSLDPKIDELFFRLKKLDILSLEINFLQNYRSVLLSEKAMNLGDEFWHFHLTASLPTDIYALLMGYIAYQLEQYQEAGKYWAGLIGREGIDLFEEDELSCLMNEDAIDESLYYCGKNIRLEKERVRLKEFLNHVEYFTDLEAWQKYLHSDESYTNNYKERKEVIQNFLIGQEGYQYVSYQILDYLCQYFSWHSKEDFSHDEYRQDTFLLMKAVPKFSFEVCQYLHPNHRKSYLRARYQLYSILNQCRWSEQFWGEQLNICEKLYADDLEVEMLKIWRDMQIDYKSIQRKEDFLTRIHLLEGYSDHLGYRFLLQYKNLLEKNTQMVDIDFKLKRPSVVPVKVFHLLMGHLCYQLGSYNLSCSHWRVILEYEVDFVRKQELEIFDKYNFDQIDSFLFLGKHAQFIDLVDVEYSLRKNGHLVKRKYSAKKSTFSIILSIVIALYQFGGSSFFSENKPAQIKKDISQIIKAEQAESWSELKNAEVEKRYCYYMYGPGANLNDRKLFFKQDSKLSEARQTELVQHAIKKEEVISFPRFIIYHYPQSDGTNYHLVTKNGKKVLAFLAEDNQLLTEVYSGELTSDQLFLKDAQQQVERSPYGLAKYILEYYFFQSTDEDVEKDKLLMKNTEVYQKLLAVAQEQIVQREGKQAQIMVRSYDSGCAVLFLDYDKDIYHDGTWMELLFNEKDQLVGLESADVNEKLPEKWRNLAHDPNYEDITEKYITVMDII